MSAFGDGCAYSLPHYRSILRRAKRHYWLPKVREVAFGVPDRSFLLVRHDVDITPDAALEMAALEASEGVESTYYFRLHAPFYNLLEPATLETVHAIAGMGHEVGLHYEPRFFLDRGLDPVAGTRRDIRVFEELVGLETRTIAQHEPSRGPRMDGVSPHHPCAYQPALVRDIPYFADSGFHWREGCICTKLGTLPRVHTLVHPHSWVLGDRPWREVLRAHADALGDRIRGEMDGYIASLERYLSRRAELDRERVARYEE